MLVPGTILVADRSAFGGTGALIAVDPAGGAQRVLSSGGHFVNPSDVVVGADGSVLVVDSDAFGGNGGVIRVNPDTGAQAPLSQGPLAVNPFAGALEAGGTIVLASGLGSRVVRVDPIDGGQAAVLPGPMFESATDVAVAPDGSILVVVDVETGGRLARVDRLSGAEIPLAGANFSNPLGVAVEADGIVWFVEDRHGVGPSLIRYDTTTGQRTRLTERNLLRGPFRVAIEAGGSFVISDPDFVDDQGRLVRVDRATGAQSVLSAGGHFVHPFGVAVV